MEFFSQFTWALPHAFSDALAKCQFVEGDVLYLNQKAYQKKFNAQAVGSTFQVLYPERQRAAPKEDINQVFLKNWESEVRIQEYEVASPSSNQLSIKGGLITTTQGRLYDAMWHGDVRVLDLNVDAPAIPFIDSKELVRLIEVQPEIKEKGIVIQERITETRLEKSESMALKKSNGKLVFALPFDRANDTSHAKYRTLCDELKDDLESEPILLTAKQANLDESEHVRPTLKIALFVLSVLDREGLEEKIKKATYVPNKNKKTDRVSYDIRRHCCIFE